MAVFFGASPRAAATRSDPMAPTWQNSGTGTTLKVGKMTFLVLLGVLVIAVGGCVCVVWAARGGPGWVRAVAAVTLGAGELLRRSAKRRRRLGGGGNNGGDAG